jgi:hypothetical protein
VETAKALAVGCSKLGGLSLRSAGLSAQVASTSAVPIAQPPLPLRAASFQQQPSKRAR